MVSGQKSYTAAGNMCSPSKVQCLNRMKERWSSLYTELNQKSFHSSAISTKVDGSEDVEIRRLKVGEVTAISSS